MRHDLHSRNASTLQLSSAPPLGLWRLSELLRLTGLHIPIASRDTCVLEGLAALLGMQLAPTLPMLKRSSRRGSKKDAFDFDRDDAEAPTRVEKVKRRSSEFVISMARKSGTFL